MRGGATRTPISSEQRVIPAQAGIKLLSGHEAGMCLHTGSGWNGTLYVGVSSDLIKRVWEHKNDVVEGFTKKYRIHDLVWFEQHDTMESAIRREKAIKQWKRSWKIKAIELPILCGVISTPTFFHDRNTRAGSRPPPG